jgi:HEPN domain-containing protein
MVSRESLDLAQGWLAKARNDLEAARLLIHDEKRLLDIAAYHCQQAAEKALKAWLIAKEIISRRPTPW